MQQNAFTLVVGYKSCKNFINLCNHNSDHGLEAEWRFIATSNGKSPCDGIGCTVKRLTAHVSLQISSGQVISTPQRCFNGAKMLFLALASFISSEDIDNHVNQFQIDHHHELTNTLPGTRSYHSFIPYGLSKLIL